MKIPLFVSRKPRFLGVSGFQLFQVFEPQSVDGLTPNLSSKDLRGSYPLWSIYFHNNDGHQRGEQHKTPDYNFPPINRPETFPFIPPYKNSSDEHYNTSEE
ncbi:MAG: hypothetical protein NZ820_12715 [Dehalococcoidia bacterium]|nr:hypothetical protein [Dehalococcoidia bacterium]